VTTQELIWKSIEAIAVKLNTSVEYLWTVMLLQAKVHAIFWAIITALSLFFAFIAFVMWCWCRPKWETYTQDKKTAINMAWFCFLIPGVLGTIVSLFHLYSLITALINPEGWAFLELLDRMREAGVTRK
jgi:TRAP-type C4-dicarboxylate transport system permease small subunit